MEDAGQPSSFLDWSNVSSSVGMGVVHRRIANWRRSGGSTGGVFSRAAGGCIGWASAHAARHHPAAFFSHRHGAGVAGDLRRAVAIQSAGRQVHFAGRCDWARALAHGRQPQTAIAVDHGRPSAGSRQIRATGLRARKCGYVAGLHRTCRAISAGAKPRYRQCTIFALGLCAIFCVVGEQAA